MKNISKIIQYVKIKSSFAYLPSHVVDNIKLAEYLSTKDKTPADMADTISKHTGIYERRYALYTEAASDLAIQAIKASSIDLKTISALLVATTSGDFPSPATATFVHKGLRLNNKTHCLDIASSCSSFLSALRSSFGFLTAQENTLVVATELKHKGLTENDLRTKSLFADGAGGVYLTEGNEKDDFLVFIHQESQSELAQNILIPVGGSREPVTLENIERNKLTFTDAKFMYLQTVKAITNAIENCWKTRNEYLLTRNKKCIACTIYIHQANKNILTDVMAKLPEEISTNIPTLMADVGNMVCASLPVLRTRVLFLKAIFFHTRTQIAKDNLINHFLTLCANSSFFSYEKDEKGICFKTHFFAEEISIYDACTNNVHESWLARIDVIEYNSLQKIFTNEYKIYEGNKEYQFLDIWIAAGGGFQTIGLLHGNI
ncbi:3-oxoacyl-ACP synthase III family protein [Fluviispira vulneris]|uniref:3-oxoacyl-ACP synthase III family protein n=1 Tax=Fluviispira vulneris TaxID=2763012 RepID=UPI001646A718|nr:hypothetical protein [Fluviispira vulneris]